MAANSLPDFVAENNLSEKSSHGNISKNSQHDDVGNCYEDLAEQIIQGNLEKTLGTLKKYQDRNNSKSPE